MINITLSNVAVHFNKDAISAPAERFQYKLLNKFGATVRTTQRNSMKRGREVRSRTRNDGKADRRFKVGFNSEPGQPPLRHPGAKVDIKETVFYFMDRAKKEVVIGMVLLDGRPAGDKAMPGVLEHSGTATIQRKRARDTVVRTIRVEARPSAQPAFDKTTKKQLPGLIAGGITREA